METKNVRGCQPRAQLRLPTVCAPSPATETSLSNTEQSANAAAEPHRRHSLYNHTLLSPQRAWSATEWLSAIDSLRHAAVPNRNSFAEFLSTAPHRNLSLSSSALPVVSSADNMDAVAHWQEAANMHRLHFENKRLTKMAVKRSASEGQRWDPQQASPPSLPLPGGSASKRHQLVCSSASSPWSSADDASSGTSLLSPPPLLSVAGAGGYVGREDIFGNAIWRSASEGRFAAVGGAPPFPLLTDPAAAASVITQRNRGVLHAQLRRTASNRGASTADRQFTVPARHMSVAVAQAGEPPPFSVQHFDQLYREQEEKLTTLQMNLMNVTVQSQSLATAAAVDQRSSSPSGGSSASLPRIFECHFCQKQFTRGDILSRHLKGHTGDRPFVCHYCGRTFTRKDHLCTHMRTHTNEKPYICHICQYAARRRDVLTRHLKQHDSVGGGSTLEKKEKEAASSSSGDINVSRTAVMGSDDVGPSCSSPGPSGALAPNLCPDKLTDAVDTGVQSNTSVRRTYSLVDRRTRRKHINSMEPTTSAKPNRVGVIVRTERDETNSK